MEFLHIILNKTSISEVLSNNYSKYLNEEDFKKMTKFLQDFLKLKFEIAQYFEDFINSIDQSKFMCFLDLHQDNFGFIKGTKQIRCFDPIYIKELSQK